MKAGEEARLVAYASGNFAKNVLWATADVTLLFILTDLLGVKPATAGVIFLTGLLCDAFLDPAIGALVERTRTRLGQYGPFIIAGAPLSAGAFLLLYSLPYLGVRDLAAVVGCVLLFRSLFAVADLPHTALITRVSSSSRVRSRVAGYRFFFSSLASLLLSLTIPHITAPPNQATHLALFALVAATVSAITLFMAWFFVRDRDHPAPPGRKANLFGDMAAAARNPAFAALGLITFCTGLTAPLFAKSCVYYAKYVLAEPKAAGLALTTMALGQFAGVGLWTWAAIRYEKASALCAAHLLAAAAFLVIAVLTPGATTLALLAGCAGVGLSGVFMLIWGMAPDVVDYGEYRQGGRHEATTFALLLLVSKSAMGLGGAALGWTLQAIGYRPDAVQTDLVLNGITIVTCVAPAAGCLACAALTRRYLLTHRRHARAVAGIARKGPPPALET